MGLKGLQGGHREGLSVSLDAVLTVSLHPGTIVYNGGELLTLTANIVRQWIKYFKDLLNSIDMPSREDAQVDSSITQFLVEESGWLLLL